MALAGTSVLVLEDDDDTRELLVAGLELYGATVRSVASAEAALTDLMSKRSDVLLADLALPAIDGFTLLRLMRANPNLASIPAIALSGHGSIADRELSLQVGFQKHLVKPAHLADIVSAISLVRGPSRVDEVQPTIDLRCVLAALSSASSCRFASLVRFATNDTLISLWTHDRERPDVDPFPLALPIHASFCVLMRTTPETIKIENTAHEARLANHSRRFDFGCYLGTPLFYRDGRVFGTVCCYDELPHEFAPGIDRELEETARRLEPDLWRLFEAAATTDTGRSGAIAPASAAT